MELEKLDFELVIISDEFRWSNTGVENMQILVYAASQDGNGTVGHLQFHDDIV
jgi:hypothetical protein